MAYGSYSGSYGGYSYVNVPGVGGSDYSSAEQYESYYGSNYGQNYSYAPAQQSSGNSGNSGNSGSSGASSGLGSALGSAAGSALGSALAGAHQAASGVASDANYAASGLNSLVSDVANGNGQSAIVLIGIVAVAFVALAMMQAKRS
jgi:hypothetical protein